MCRDAAEHCFAQMAVPIAAHDKQTGAAFKGRLEQSLSGILCRTLENLLSGRDAVQQEIFPEFVNARLAQKR